MNHRLLLLPFVAGCVFFHDSSDAEGTGAGGTGAGPATSAGAGGTGAGGTGAGAAGAGAAGAGGSDCVVGELGDAKNCGACDWDCGPGVTKCSEGVCGAFSSSTTERIQGLAVIDNSVITTVHATGTTDTDRLDRRPVTFAGPQSTVDLFNIDSQEDGIGFVARAQVPMAAGVFLYAPQDPTAPPALLRCSNFSPCPLADVRDLATGAIAAGHVSGLASVGSDLYMLFQTKYLGKAVTSDCLDGVGNCEILQAAGPMLTSVGLETTLTSRILEVQAVPMQPAVLWWTSFNYFNAACVYRWTVNSSASANVPCALELDGLFEVSVAGDRVFVGTGGEPGNGPIHRILDPNAVQLPLVSTPLGGPGADAAFPADTDSQFLFAFNPAVSALVALRDDGIMGQTALVGSAPVEQDEVVVSVDASHEEYVLFATALSNGSSKLYRWRKPFLAQ